MDKLQEQIGKFLQKIEDMGATIQSTNTDVNYGVLEAHIVIPFTTLEK